MSKIDFRQLANEGVRSLTPYQPGKTIEALERELGIISPIKLASNENPLGPSEKAISIAKEALLQTHFYPDGECTELKQVLSNFLSVDANQITVGNGSENILELIVKSYLHKNDTAIISQYAFLTIPILMQSYGVNTKVIPAKNWGHDIDSMIAAIDDNTRVLFLVNPNNPTGTYTDKQDFSRLMQSVPSHVLVVVDEAYFEYIRNDNYPDVLSYLKNFQNLVIIRTFSKAYGLAALRIGYSISSLEIADMLNRSRLPFNVNAIAAKAACAALLDHEHLEKAITLNQQGLKQMIQGLEKLKFDFISSIANFITINVHDAEMVYQKLLRLGVIVRPLSAYGMPEYIRVSIGTPEQISHFLGCLEKAKHIIY